MPRLLFMLPVPLPEIALEGFAAQIPASLRRADMQLDFASPSDGAFLVDSPFESVVADFTVAAAAHNAQAQGYDLVCSFTMSDSGVVPLRGLLDIPVIGAGETAFHLACQLGKTFSVITMWERWLFHSTKNAAALGLTDRLASVRHIDTRPDAQELLAGKEEVVFAKLEAAARAAIEQDGAEVIVLGSTTMYQSHAYLAERLPCPVINPGTAAYKMCETVLDLGLRPGTAGINRPERLSPTLFSRFDPPNVWLSR